MILSLVVLLLLLAVTTVNGLSEPERIEEYYKRYSSSSRADGDVWPPKEYLPKTVGWKKLFSDRFQQVYAINDYNERYEGLLQTVFPALLAPNFTEYGFGIAKAPAGLTSILQDAIRQGLLEMQNLPLESQDIGVIEGPRAWFLDRPDLMDLVLQQLQPYAEAWSKVKLHPYEAYGFRIYQNQSKLAMHVDKKETHVISAIYHIDRDANAKPWPIYIEDFATGATHEVYLQLGELLFYESSKCFHGRPTTFDGTYFTSVFVHYTPLDWPFSSSAANMESHYIIPPNWWNRKTNIDNGNDPKEESVPRTTTKLPPSAPLPKIEMLGTSFKEPTCPNGWCATQNAIKFSSSSTSIHDQNDDDDNELQEGYWMDPTGKKHPLLLLLDDDTDTSGDGSSNNNKPTTTAEDYVDEL